MHILKYYYWDGYFAQGVEWRAFVNSFPVTWKPLFSKSWLVGGVGGWSVHFFFALCVSLLFLLSSPFDLIWFDLIFFFFLIRFCVSRGVRSARFWLQLVQCMYPVHSTSKFICSTLIYFTFSFCLRCAMCLSNYERYCFVPDSVNFNVDHS